MKLNNLKNIFFVVSFVTFLFSCEEEEKSYPKVTDKPMVSITSSSNAIPEFDNASTTTVRENRIVYTLTLSKAHKSELRYKVSFLDNSSASIDDVIVNLNTTAIDDGPEGYTISIPANALTASFSIDANQDVLPETAETANFKLESVGNFLSDVSDNSKNFSINISNSTNNNLFISFDWPGTYLDATGGTHDRHDYDFDLEIYPQGATTPIFDDYNGAPATITFPSTYADGTYEIVPSFWTNVGPVAPALPINFNTTITVAKPGVFIKTYPLNGVFNSAVGGDQQANPNAYQNPLYFVKTGTTYQVYETGTNNLIVSGRGINTTTKKYGGRKK